MHLHTMDHSYTYKVHSGASYFFLMCIYIYLIHSLFACVNTIHTSPKYSPNDCQGAYVDKSETNAMRGVLLRARPRGTADRDSQADQLTHSRAWPDIRRDDTHMDQIEFKK